MQLFSVAVFTNLVTCAMCWTAGKCFVYEDCLNDVILDNCPKSNLTGYCEYVSDVELDLAQVPSQIEVLCLYFQQDVILHPSSFSRFQKLKELHLYAGISTFNPGAFKHLSSLHYLDIWCRNSTKFSLTSEILSDLQNLPRLWLNNCRLSSMTVDVFKGLKNLEELVILNSVQDFTELLCRLTFVSSSLNLLYVQSNKINISHPKCTFPNGTSFDVKEIHEIENVGLLFGHARVIDKKALRFFPEVKLLSIKLTEFEVIKSEITKLNRLQISVGQLSDFEELCEIVHDYLVTSLEVHLTDSTDSSVPNLNKCIRVESLHILSIGYQTKAINLTFISILRNLTTLRLKRLIDPESHDRDKALALCENQSDVVTKLKTVDLHTNNFRNISFRHFSCLRDLEELLWVGSNIEHVEDFTFNNTNLLRTLDLSSNRITRLTKYTFFGLSNLKTFLVNENKLLVIEEATLFYLTSIEVVGLGVFQYPSPEPSKIQINLSVPDNLTKLYISSGIRPMTLMLSNSRRSEVGLSLHVCGEAVTFQDCNNTFFESLVQLTAETEQLLCAQSFPAQTFPAPSLKSLRHLIIKAIRRTTPIDLKALNRLVNLESLILFNVDLSHQSGLDVIFHNLSKLEILHLYYCSIPLLEKDLSRDLQSLRVLVLHQDVVFSMMENFLEPLKNLRYFIMQEAVLHCSCDNVWITNWVKYQKSIQVFFSGLLLERLPCMSADGTKLLLKYAQEFCFIDVDFLLFVSTSLGVLFFMLVVLFHQLAGDYLLAFIHIARAWIEEAMRANRKGHYNFDVFVSYCGKDERWVMDELLPNLEKRGPPFLRLCLHSRDFALGKDIVENITDSLYRSRHTLCLVSCNYLRSNWCSLEMRLATYRLLAEHRDVLILVFLEKVPHQLLNVHHRLSRLVKTRTYIDWPQDPALRNEFWDRLWTKLTPEPAT